MKNSIENIPNIIPKADTWFAVKWKYNKIHVK